MGAFPASVTEQPCVGFDSSTSAGLPEVIPLGLLPGCTYGPGEKIDMGHARLCRSVGVRMLSAAQRNSS